MTATQEKQLQLFEGEIRPSRKTWPRGKQGSAWNGIDGRIARLQQGLLLTSGHQVVNIPQHGANLDEVLSLIRAGYWRTMNGLHTTVLGHPAHFGEDAICDCMTALGWTIDRITRHILPPLSEATSA